MMTYIMHGCHFVNLFALFALWIYSLSVWLGKAFVNKEMCYTYDFGIVFI